MKKGLRTRSQRARACSPFLSLQLDRFPAIADALARGDAWRGGRRWPGVPATRRPTLAASLRRERNALAAALAVGDLAGSLPLET